MPRRTTSSGLACLDRGFVAEFSGDELDRRFPGGGITTLIRRGILADAGLASTITGCICDLRRPSCVLSVYEKDTRYWAHCDEYGLPIEVTRAQVQRYQFNWRAWADWLRRKCRLEGPDPVLGAGALWVGCGTVGGLDFGLVVVAPGCRRAADLLLPEGVRVPGRPIVGLMLGEPREALPLDATVPAAALSPDLGTIDGSVLERALAGTPYTATATSATKIMFYSHERKPGRAIDEAEYERLHRPDVLKTYDVFIDLLVNRVWRNGRAYTTVLNGAGKATKRKLGRIAVSLLADYVRRPHTPMSAGATPTYRDSPTGARSAAGQLAAVRRSVHMKEAIRSGDRARTPGETTYYFEPGGMTWCVLDHLPPK